MLLQRACYGPALITRSEKHPFGYLAFILSGQFDETTRHGTRTRKAGTLHFHAPCEANEGTIGAEDCTVVSVAAYPEIFSNLSIPCDVEIPDLGAPELFELCYFAEREPSRQLAANIAGRLFERFALEAQRAVRYPPDWLALAQDRLAKGIPVRDVADGCGIHPASFARAFRTWVHATPQQYALEARILAAKGLLEDSNTSIGEIALESGYSDQSHMDRAFKSKFGISPLQYRKIARG